MSNKRLSATINIGGAVAGSLKSAIGETQRSISRVGEAVADVTRRQRELNAVIAQQERMGASGSAMRVSYAQQELAALDRKLAKLRQVQALEAKATVLAGKRAEIGGALRGNVTGLAAAALPVGASVLKSARFGYDSQLIGNTANMAPADIARMNDGIMAASKATAQSATDVQAALGSLIASGMDIGTAQQMILSIGKAATSAGAEIGDIARAVFTLNDSLKINPGDMLAALDTLAVAGKEGNVELRDMAKQLPVLGAGFVSLKMQGRKAAATMAASLEIARKGAADADEAANNMKNFIAKVMSPETLKKAKKTFGLDLYKIIQDAQKKGGNPFEAAMVAIMKATKGDQKAIGELFQDMQVQNFLRPMIQNWEKYQEIKAKALKGDGTVESDFAKVLRTDWMQIQRVGQAFQRFAIVAGGALSTAFGGKGGLADRIDGVTKWVDANRELVGSVTKVGAAVMVGRVAVNAFRFGLVAVQSAVVASRLAWARFALVLPAIGAALAPIAVPLAAVGAALVVGGLVLRKYWEPASAWLQGVGQGFTSVMTQAGPLGDAFRVVGDSVGTVWGWFMKLLEPVRSSQAELKAAMDSGRQFGQVLGEAFALAFKPLSMLIGGIQWVIGSAAKLKAALSNTGGDASALNGGYDAMGNYTGAAAPALPQPAMRSTTTTVNNTTNVAPATVVVNAKDANAKEVAAEVDRLLKRQREVEGRSRMYDGTNQ